MCFERSSNLELLVVNSGVMPLSKQLRTLDKMTSDWEKSFWMVIQLGTLSTSWFYLVFSRVPSCHESAITLELQLLWPEGHWLHDFENFFSLHILSSFFPSPQFSWMHQESLYNAMDWPATCSLIRLVLWSACRRMTTFSMSKLYLRNASFVFNVSYWYTAATWVLQPSWTGH